MLYLFDNKRKEKKLFTTISHDFVRMYVCGPTVYDYAHLGNARPVVVFDLLYRLLKHYYKKVVYVRNFTDIDDKIIDRLNGTGIKDYTQKYIDAFHEDMDALGALRPSHEPKATEYIQGMIDMINGLISQGYAYVRDHHVLFRVTAYPNYGSLSRMSEEQLEVGARVEVASYKDDPKDFVLWKPSTDSQPGWESPWGRGRPGWHIECSVMSSLLLGKYFDIHGGGIDLVFPHHENEQAQSCCFHGADEMANFWMHNGHLTVQGEKMSKSLGNFTTIRDLLKEFNGETIRYAFLSSHYRQPMDFSYDGLKTAHRSLNKIYTALRNYEAVKPSEPDQEVLEALSDDMNTPQALSIIHQRAHDINVSGSEEKVSQLKSVCHLMGLLTYSNEGWFENSQTLSAKYIEELIAKRKSAREAKNYEESDRIRKELEDAGITLEDTSSGTIWRTSSK